MAKKAFVVGINDYAPVGSGGPDLHGCVNDAADMAHTLVVCGFPTAGIRLCTDKQATKAGILKGLAWLLEGAKKNDSLVFFYSGHGSQVTDFSGDEPDKKDEVLCPHDINFATKTYICDDDLRTIFSKLPAGVNLEAILDSCHSGTATRLLEGCRGADEGTTDRYLPPPLEFTFHLEYQPDLPKRSVLRAARGAKEIVVVPGLNHTLWAACRDLQTSQETNIGGNIRGVFTYHFCQVLRKTSGSIERRRLESLVASDIRKGGMAASAATGNCHSRTERKTVHLIARQDRARWTKHAVRGGECE